METQMQAGSQPRAAVTNQDDRIWAAIAHGSALFVFFGPVIPVILWFTLRKKSAYVAFQALQAMIYQSLFFWTWVLLIPLLMIVIVVIVVIGALLLVQEQGNQLLIGLLPQLVIWGVLIGTFVVYAGIGVWGAVASLLGRDFRYPFFGQRMARQLEYHGPETASLPEDKEDQVAAAVCHSTAVVAFWGLLTPLAVWITQGERSAFLRFQGLQALLYQVIGLLGYFAFLVLDFAFVFGTVGLTLFAAGSGSSSSSIPVWMSAASLIFLPIVCVFVLGSMAYQVLAFVAAVRVLRGHDFHYPILGKLLAAKLGPAEGK